MAVESTPAFSTAAANLWASIPSEGKKILLESVWCSKCRHAVTITHFTGVVKNSDLLLVGKCSACHADVARLIESG